jgi:hypothetical protein
MDSKLKKRSAVNPMVPENVHGESGNYIFTDGSPGFDSSTGSAEDLPNVQD